MADRKQLYTVKRIETGEPRNSTGAKPAVFEILGPGAPEKPIASEPIAIMIRDALEQAGQVLVAEAREKVLREINNGCASALDDFSAYFDDHDREEPGDVLRQWVITRDGLVIGVGDRFTDALADAVSEVNDLG